MDVKKVEKNLTNFSKYILDKVESDIKLLETKNSKTAFDKSFKEKINI
jgi:hypothetical protein